MVASMPRHEVDRAPVVVPATLIVSPTRQPFVYALANAPLFFVKPTRAEQAAFDQNFVAITRAYWRAVRHNPQISHRAIFTELAPLSCGECAILSLRKKHERRRCSSFGRRKNM
jgi:hypothetical protein